MNKIAAPTPAEKNSEHWTIVVVWKTNGEDVKLPQRFQLPSDIRIDMDDEDDEEMVLDWLSDKYGCDVRDYDLLAPGSLTEELLEGEAIEQISFETTALYVLDDGETYSSEVPTRVLVTDSQLERIDQGTKAHHFML